MNLDTFKNSEGSTAVRRHVRGVEVCRQLARQVIDGWNGGAPVDAQAVLTKNSELAEYKSVVLDLLYEEFCIRTEQGESVSVSEFCDRFPDYQHSIRHQIEIHRLIADCPGLIPEWVTWPQDGDELLGYTIVEELGKGAFARAYLAREEALGSREVVIKVAPHGESEAQTLGRLKHENIVPVHSVQCDESTGLTVICMPFLGRATLNDVLDTLQFGTRRPRRARDLLQAVRPTDADEASADDLGPPHRLLRRGGYIDGILHLGGQLADALATAHAAGVLHLDIKPSNVLMTSNGTPKLLDFNLSRDRFQDGARVGGTLPYMSPEQLGVFVDPLGSTSIDGRSDVFSLGVILYQLLGGQLPYGEMPDQREAKEIALELIARQKSGPRSIQSQNADVDRGVMKLIQRCLAFDPNDRFETPSELALALRRELQLLRQVMRWIAAHPWTVRVIGLSVVAVTAVAVTFLATRDEYHVAQYKAGLAAYDRGEDEIALVRLNRALKAKPDHAQAALLRARTLVRGGWYEEASSGLRRFVKTNPDVQAMAYLGYCYNKRKNHLSAITWYDHAIESDLGSAAVYNNLGYSYLRLNRLGEAERALTTAIELDRRLVAAWHNRAIAGLRLAEDEKRIPDQAIEDIKQAIALDDPVAAFHRDAARIYAFAGKFDLSYESKAFDHCRRALELGVP